MVRSHTAGGVAPDVGGACSAAAMASANTAWVLRGSIEVGSTANTRLSLRAAPSSFSAGPSANTSTTARGTCACAALTAARTSGTSRSEEHTSELQSQSNLVCRLLLEKKNIIEHDDTR